jgi:hypothetical protein
MKLSTCGIPLTSFVCAALCLLPSAQVRAQKGPRSAAVTFNAPVQLPGLVLPKGTYTFEHVPSVSEAASVVVSTGQPKRVVGRFTTLPTRRVSAGEAVTFHHTQTNGAPAIAAWYFNGGSEGYEFVYTAQELRLLTLAPAAP